MSGPRSNSNSTKQLLDELDSLMQRMLELPVADSVEDAPVAPVLNPPHLASLANPPVLPEPPRSLAPPPAQPLAAPPKESAKPEPTAPRLHPAHRAPAFVPLAKEEAPPRVPERFAAKEISFDDASEPPPVVVARSVPREKPLPPPPAARPKRPTYAPLSPVPAAKSLPESPDRAEGMHLVLEWTNRAFDHTIGRLGSTGEWLQTKSGRRMLGWSGIALFAVAFAWGLAKLLG